MEKAVRSAEKALENSEKKFRSLVATMREGLGLHEIIYDGSQNAVDDVILQVNSAYGKMVGMQKEAVVGKEE